LPVVSAVPAERVAGVTSRTTLIRSWSLNGRRENLRYTDAGGLPRIHDSYDKWGRNLVESSAAKRLDRGD
jgi:hypothetical protein